MTNKKWIGTVLGIISTVGAIIAVPWGGVIQFGSGVIFLQDNYDELEHVLDDYHQVLSLDSKINSTQAELDSVMNVLFVVANRDSLIHVMELMNRGKLPYDSIWRISESGHWYRTTIQNHYENEHHD
jgi:hypothetical protein